ncbi:MAG: hypothetical protein JNJ65_11670 [Cyclobacteriaceae bacterium]|nr:hypothetical protein [Cyclobacteriaceae bacterium]
MLSSFSIRAYPISIESFLAQAFNSQSSLFTPGWGSDTLWVGFGLSVGICGLHNVWRCKR